jgi:hypothetical protein
LILPYTLLLLSPHDAPVKSPRTVESPKRFPTSGEIPQGKHGAEGRGQRAESIAQSAWSMGQSNKCMAQRAEGMEHGA